MIKSEIQHYQYLAFCVVRDALGFFLGIPKFLDEDNLRNVYDRALAEKLNSTKRLKCRELTNDEINKCVKSVDRVVGCRIKELSEDLQHCEEVLFEDNLWLQILNLNPNFIKDYLDKLSPQMLNDLAVVPKWGINDHSLGRSYINDGFSKRISFHE